MPTIDNGMQTFNSVTNVLAPTAATGPIHLDLPARVSVVQIGEIAPPQSMLASLRAEPKLFQTINPQSGTADADHSGNPRDQLNQMRLMAQNLGADYLLVFGGNIDAGHQETGIAVLNLTIIGGFIVPSTVVHVGGKAAGSLLDVRTGRVVMNFSSETVGNGIVPSFFADNTQTASVDSAKTNLVKDLTADVIRQMGEQVKPAPPVTAMVK